MPIYVYNCKRCKHIVEELQGMSDKLLTTCPKCQQPTLEKILPISSFRLKGSGWSPDGYSKNK